MNKKQRFMALLFLLYAIIGIPAIASNEKISNNREWSNARKSEGISLYYRWVNIGDSINAREMKAVFEIKADIPEILSCFSNTEGYESWAAGIKKCHIEKINDSVWYTHTVMNYPFPLKQKDMVTRHMVKKNGLNANIEIIAAPDYFSKLIGIERLENYNGNWHFSRTQNGTTIVDYRVISFTKPIFPRFIQDPIVQKIFIKSLNDLKRLAENNEEQ